MPHYEVHTLAQDRWLIDGVFFDKTTAIDDAKILLGRTRALDAVRVLQVEERRNGFFEWTVYAAARPRPSPHRRAAPDAPAAAAQPSAVAPLRMIAPQRAVTRAAASSSYGSGRGPALLFVSMLALFGLMVLFAHRPHQPKWVWVFDRPEAWQRHDIVNPWSGEVSR